MDATIFLKFCVYKTACLFFNFACVLRTSLNQFKSYVFIHWFVELIALFQTWSFIHSFSYPFFLSQGSGGQQPEELHEIPCGFQQPLVIFQLPAVKVCASIFVNFHLLYNLVIDTIFLFLNTNAKVIDGLCAELSSYQCLHVSSH